MNCNIPVLFYLQTYIKYSSMSCILTDNNRR